MRMLLPARLLRAPPGCPGQLGVYLPSAPPSSPNPGDCCLRLSASPSGAHLSPGLADSPVPVTAWAPLPASPGGWGPSCAPPLCPLGALQLCTGVPAHSLPGAPLLTAWPPPRARGCLSLSALEGKAGKRRGAWQHRPLWLSGVRAGRKAPGERSLSEARTGGFRKTCV